MERIRSAGNSDLLVSLVKRVGEGRSVTVENPSEVNVVPYTVIEPRDSLPLSLPGTIP